VIPVEVTRDAAARTISEKRIRALIITNARAVALETAGLRSCVKIVARSVEIPPFLGDVINDRFTLRPRHISVLSALNGNLNAADSEIR